MTKNLKWPADLAGTIWIKGSELRVGVWLGARLPATRRHCDPILLEPRGCYLGLLTAMCGPSL